MGTVIDKSWILTSASCCKADDIVSINFNDYSIFYADKDEVGIKSSVFHVHPDLNACLIRTVDISKTITFIPCMRKVSIYSLLSSNEDLVTRFR